MPLAKKYKRIIRISIITITILFILFNLVAMFQAYRFTHPVSKPINQYKDYNSLELTKIAKMTLFGVPPLKSEIDKLPSDLGIDFEAVTFETVDGIKVRGWFIPTDDPKGTILLLHGWNSNKQDLLKHALFLDKNQYSSLLIDFRGAGESSGDSITLGYYEKNEVEAAIEYLKTRDGVYLDKIGALAFSMGGAALLNYEYTNNDIDAIVVVGTYNNLHDTVANRFRIVYGFPKFPFATFLVFYGGLINGFNAFQLSPQEYVKGIKIPIFIISGEKDDRVSVKQTKKIYSNANEPKELWIIEEEEHSSIYELGSEEYEERVVNFFDRYIQ